MSMYERTVFISFEGYSEWLTPSIEDCFGEGALGLVMLSDGRLWIARGI
jgi:hypothetical protein